MNGLVIGGGPVGTLLGWALATGGETVALIRRGAPAGGERATLTVIRPDDGSASVDVAAAPSVARAGGGEAPDWVLLAVKAFDVEDVLSSLPPWPTTTLVSVQNGIGTEEAVLGHRPDGPLVAASLTASVELEAEGRVRWRRPGGIGLAAVRGVAGVTPAHLATSFSAAGLTAQEYPDWRSMKWSKLVGNLVANATSALLDLAPAELYADPVVYELERDQLREAFAVMRALDLRPVALPGADIPRLELALALPARISRPILGRVVGDARGGKDPSLRMGMAASAGRSEIGWLNGAVARAGATVGVATPVNAALAGLAERALDDEALRDRLRRNPAALAAAVEAQRELRGGVASGSSAPS
jgi:2-dehydropantoate 2-reductase